MAQQIAYLEELAVLLKKVAGNIFQQSGKITFSAEPTIERKDLIEYNHRMRASGIDKFNYPAYVAAVNFYRNEKDREHHNACGAMILYIKASAVEQVLKAVGMRDFNDEEEELVAGQCAEFCLQLAEDFKNELSGLGYKGLILAQPICAKNSILQGVEFSYDQYDRYEINFMHSKQKILAMDLTMSIIPRA